MTAIDRSRATAFGVMPRSDESGAFPIESGQSSEPEAVPEVSGAILALALERISKLEPSALLPEVPLPAPASASQPPRATDERDELVFSLEAQHVPELVEPPPAPFSARRVALLLFAMLLAAAIGGLTQWAIMTHEASSRPAQLAPVTASRTIAR